MNDAKLDSYLSWGNLIYTADFLEASGEKNISLLGGEPTLHPQFTEFVLYLYERGFNVNIFTSGVTGEKTFDNIARYLSFLDPAHLSFVCNINDPENTPYAESKSIEKFLAVMSQFTQLGFNIYRPDASLDFLFPTIQKFGLKPALRLGLAHPIPGAKNAHIGIKNFDAVARLLVSNIPQFERYKLFPTLDCGFPYCIFSNEEIGRLFGALPPEGLKFACGAAIDIGIDLSVWSCFPLSTLKRKSLFDFQFLHEIVDYYESFHRSVRIESGGVFDECDLCRYREKGLCSGGCLGHILKEIMIEPPVRTPGLLL